jgi:T3SS negative regulator,GrlR
MLEALWSVEFTSSFGYSGNGVAVFETGRVLGGDSIMIYIGNFNVENGVIHANINVKKYADAPNFGSVVGMDNFNLVVTGSPSQSEMLLNGYVVEDPTRKISIKAVRRAELP